MIGITDLPCYTEDDDELDITRYVNGLEKFIQKCPTPMSIAIQGDWGTGKTSTMNMLQKRLEQYQNIRCVYFNTWQYSQFSMSDDLYLSFVNSLVHKCCNKKENADLIMKSVFSLGKKVAFSMVEKATGVDGIEDLIQKQEEKMESIENLKMQFSKMIADEVRTDGRVVIFIDDLDRLNPEVAVELLEVIKLFMDVENCIFVLAIDYDVVVNGVRNKYGQNVSERKCRSFFDKIIQLPFSLPVQAYDLGGLVKRTVANYINDDYIDDVTEFVSGLLGANPRAYKRLANSFFLIESVNGEVATNKESKNSNVLIFASLCIQMCLPKLYKLILSITDDDMLEQFRQIKVVEDLNQFITNYQIDITIDKDEVKSICRCIQDFFALIDVVYPDKRTKLYKTLSEVLSLTAITSVQNSSGVKKKAAAQKVNQIVVNGQGIAVKNTTEAIVITFATLFNRNAELMYEFMNEGEQILTDDPSRINSIFRSKTEIYSQNGQTIFVGHSTGTNAKMKHVTKLCQFLNKKGIDASVIWKNDGEVIYESK